MRLILLLAVFASLNVFAETTIRHPIFVDGDKGEFPIARINKYLSKKEKFPEYFEVSSDEKSEAADARYGELNDRFEKVMKSWGKKYENLSLNLGVIPTALDTKDYKTCYLGDGRGVPDTVMTLVSYQFTEQLTIYGWKYRSQIWVSDNVNPNDKDNEAFFPKEWLNWNPRSSDVLMLGSYGDDGTDVNVMIIGRCK